MGCCWKWRVLNGAPQEGAYFSHRIYWYYHPPGLPNHKPGRNPYSRATLTGPVRSIFLHKHSFQDLCACLFQPVPSLAWKGSLSFQCRPSNRHQPCRFCSPLLCRQSQNLSSWLRDFRTRLLGKCYLHTPHSIGCSWTRQCLCTCSLSSTRPSQTSGHLSGETFHEPPLLSQDMRAYFSVCLVILCCVS